MERLLNPAGERNIGKINDVITVHVCQEDRMELVRFDPRLDESDHRSTTCVELQRDITVSNEYAGAGPSGGGVGNAGSREGDSRGHGGALRRDATVHDGADSVDRRGQHVTGMEESWRLACGADSAGGAREHDIAGQQLDE